MHYLLCYTESNGDNVSVIRETFESFEDAVARYTLLCHTRESVSLSDTYNTQIIRQMIRADRYETSTIVIS